MSQKSSPPPCCLRTSDRHAPLLPFPPQTTTTRHAEHPNRVGHTRDGQRAARHPGHALKYQHSRGHSVARPERGQHCHPHLHQGRGLYRPCARRALYLCRLLSWADPPRLSPAPGAPRCPEKSWRVPFLQKLACPLTRHHPRPNPPKRRPSGRQGRIVIDIPDYSLQDTRRSCVQHAISKCGQAADRPASPIPP